MTREELIKINGPREHKITGSLGVYDAYKWIRKNKWFGKNPITEHNFYSIIRTVNKEIANELLLGNKVILPNKMGTLEIRKSKTSIKFVNGKLYNNLPIDWDKTLKLWCEDEEALKNKTLVKIQEKEVFRVHYNKTRANYNNKSLYKFKVNRDLKKRLKDSIKNGLIDAYLLNDNYD